MSLEFQRPGEYTALLVDTRKELEERAGITYSEICEALAQKHRGGNLTEERKDDILKGLKANTDFLNFHLHGVPMPDESVQYLNNSRLQREIDNKGSLVLLNPIIKSYSSHLSDELKERLREVMDIDGVV